MNLIPVSTQPENGPHESAPAIEKRSDRWLARVAILALIVLAGGLWSRYGTALFIEAASGLWALCF